MDEVEEAGEANAGELIMVVSSLRFRAPIDEDSNIFEYETKLDFYKYIFSFVLILIEYNVMFAKSFTN
jgi:hypothetical protein